MYKAIVTALLTIAVSFGLLAITTVSATALNDYGSHSGSQTPIDPDTIPSIGAKNPAATSLKQKILADGAIPLSVAEVTAHLSENTQQWSNGGAYFHKDGALDFIWEGKEFHDYTWYVKGDGMVCIKNQERFTTSCSLYFKYKNTVWTVVTEVFGQKRAFFGGPDTILVGKKLSDLEPWDPSLSGN